MIAGRFEGPCHGAKQDRLIAKLAGDDPWTERSQLVEPLDERGAEKLQVAADAAAQDHELGIEQRR